MRLSLIGATMAVVIAGSTAAAPNPSVAPAAPDPHASLPASPAQPGPSTSGVPLRHRPTVVEHYVDLNSASRKELMTLPGIGKPEADRIIANRPYLVKTDLVSKNVLPLGPFLSIKYLVVAMPKTIPKGQH
jgi:DNA uptake protein ComE-like DNA-binding protein